MYGTKRYLNDANTQFVCLILDQLLLASFSSLHDLHPITYLFGIVLSHNQWLLLFYDVIIMRDNKKERK
jgi:hypothetical protein